MRVSSLALLAPLMASALAIRGMQLSGLQAVTVAPPPRKHAKSPLNDEVAAVTARFPERHIDAPGILYALMQRVTLQNINLIEITSTYTEISFFVAQADARLLFDTFFESFSLQSDPESTRRPLARGRKQP